jgi:thiosulfate/3-mercaptopyruvate sulfurtransferase
VSRLVSAFVDGDWLQERLDDPNVRIIEASIDKASYDEAHIPGAVWVDHVADLLRKGDDTDGEVITPMQFAALMSRLGIAPGMTVVAYGDRHNSYPTRLFWTLDYYQHRGGYYVLEGGREKWLREGRPTTAETSVAPSADYPEPKTWSNENRATWEEVQTAMNAPDSVILDVRAPGEYDGSIVRAKHGGHIPGAVNIEWTEASAGANVLKSEDELRAMYDAEGVTPDKQIIAHCHLGVRASHTWFVLKHVLGYSNVKNYDGSWAEWGNRDDLPIET